MLIRNKIKCDCCQTSWELITKLRTQKYDLLITDIQMPETDGYGILELLRSSNMETAKNMPVIAVTALIENETEYIASGFARCIHKPFSMDELMNTIAQVVKKRMIANGNRISHLFFQMRIIGKRCLIYL